MTLTPPQKAFSKTIEFLESCQLSTAFTSEQAQEIALMLSNSEPWIRLSFSAASLANYLTREDPSLRRYAISDRDNLMGVICVRYPWLRGPYIELLGLFPNCRGKGVGKQVLSWAETEARRESKNLWVLTSSFNQPAISFYQRQGFYLIGTIQGLVTPEYDEILLRKCLE